MRSAPHYFLYDVIHWVQLHNYFNSKVCLFAFIFKGTDQLSPLLTINRLQAFWRKQPNGTEPKIFKWKTGKIHNKKQPTCLLKASISGFAKRRNDRRRKEKGNEENACTHAPSSNLFSPLSHRYSLRSALWKQNANTQASNKMIDRFHYANTENFCVIKYCIL